jgi:hypothetical protein
MIGLEYHRATKEHPKGKIMGISLLHPRQHNRQLPAPRAGLFQKTRRIKNPPLYKPARQ